MILHSRYALAILGHHFRASWTIAGYLFSLYWKAHKVSEAAFIRKRRSDISLAMLGGRAPSRTSTIRRALRLGKQAVTMGIVKEAAFLETKREKSRLEAINKGVLAIATVSDADKTNAAALHQHEQKNDEKRLHKAHAQFWGNGKYAPYGDSLRSSSQASHCAPWGKLSVRSNCRWNWKGRKRPFLLFSGFRNRANVFCGRQHCGVAAFQMLNLFGAGAVKGAASNTRPRIWLLEPSGPPPVFAPHMLFWSPSSRVQRRPQDQSGHLFEASVSSGTPR